MNPYAKYLGNRDPLKVIAATPSRVEVLIRALTPRQLGHIAYEAYDILESNWSSCSALHQMCGRSCSDAALTVSGAFDSKCRG